VDLAIAHISLTGSRARVVDFSIPYYLNGTAVVTPDPAIQTLSDLTQGTIAVLNGSSTIAVVRSHLPHAQLVGVESYQQAYVLLESNQVQAFAADASVLAGWIQEYPNYHLLPTLLSGDALGIAMPRGLQYDELRRQVNEAIAQWYEEGWLQERISYWGLPE
jgi:polar amino acid transport system substrate-binding protein